MTEKQASDSYSQTKARFDTEKEAARYAKRHGGHSRDRREQGCIAAALRACNLPQGATVLDLPCGAGRLAPMLVDMGYQLTEADNSPHMVDQARLAWLSTAGNDPKRLDRAKFEVQDVMKTTFPDRHFDAVICNRLLHHFVEPATRVRALTELARISKGPVIVSFFNSFALDAVKFKLKYALSRRTPNDRVPLPLTAFTTAARAAGLHLDHAYPFRWGISPQWYVLLRKA